VTLAEEARGAVYGAERPDTSTQPLGALRRHRLDEVVGRAAAEHIDRAPGYVSVLRDGSSAVFMRPIKIPVSTALPPQEIVPTDRVNRGH
jgi:hypothetical protein